MIIKSVVLLRFTNPSTFIVRLVPDKNFRVIAPPVLGVLTNWLKFLSTTAHIFLQICGDIVLGSTSNFIEIDAQEHSL